MLKLMKNHATPLRLVMGSLLVKISSSLVLPPPSLLEAFANEFQSERVIFALPDDKKSKNSFILSQIKHFRRVTIFHLHKLLNF